MKPLQEPKCLLAVADDGEVSAQQLPADEPGEGIGEQAAAQHDEGEAAGGEASHPQPREGIGDLDGKAQCQQEQECRGNRHDDGNDVPQGMARRLEPVEPGEVHQHEADEPDEQDAELRQRAGAGDQQSVGEIAGAKNADAIGGDQDG